MYLNGKNATQHILIYGGRKSDATFFLLRHDDCNNYAISYVFVRLSI